MCRILTFFLYSFVFKLKTHVMYTEWHFPKPPIWVYDVSTILLFTSRHLMDHLVNSRSPLVSRSFPGTYLGCADLSFQTNEKKKNSPPLEMTSNTWPTNRQTTALATTHVADSTVPRWKDKFASYYANAQMSTVLAEKSSALANKRMRKTLKKSVKRRVS